MANHTQQSTKLMDDAIFYTAPCENKGLGVKCLVKITNGSPVMIYQGELLTQRVANIRTKWYGHCYMMFFKYATPQGMKSMCIDGTLTDHISRYINHSRTQPNLLPVLHVKERQHCIIFYATKDIAAGEELLFDYGERRREVVKAYPWLKE